MIARTSLHYNPTEPETRISIIPREYYCDSKKQNSKRIAPMQQNAARAKMEREPAPRVNSELIWPLRHFTSKRIKQRAAHLLAFQDAANRIFEKRVQLSLVKYPVIEIRTRDSAAISASNLRRPRSVLTQREDAVAASFPMLPRRQHDQGPDIWLCPGGGGPRAVR